MSYLTLKDKKIILETWLLSLGFLILVAFLLQSKKFSSPEVMQALIPNQPHIEAPQPIDLQAPELGK